MFSLLEKEYCTRFRYTYFKLMDETYIVFTIRCMLVCGRELPMSTATFSCSETSIA